MGKLKKLLLLYGERFVVMSMNENRKKALDELFDGFSVMADGNLVFVYDVKSEVFRWSHGAVNTFGFPGEYVARRDFSWINSVQEDDREKYTESVEDLLSGHKTSFDMEYKLKRKDGQYVPCSSRGIVIRNEKGEPNFIAGTIKMQGVLTYTDSVTGLKNRYAFFQELGALIFRRQERMLLLIGVGNFGQINDIHGYGYGDRVLMHFGSLVKELFGGSGKVYRMDGTKFAVISRESESCVAKCYHVLKKRLHGGFFVDDVRHNLTIHGGLIHLDVFEVDGSTVYSCLNYSYRESKNHKHGELVTFKSNMNEDNRRALEMISVIRDSVIDDCKGFYLCYQPIVDAKTEKLIAMEALLRWRGEPYGEVPPFHFLPILEQDPIFPELGDWILRQATSDGVKFLARYPRFIMNVNLSYVQLEKDDFEDKVLAIVEETGFPPGQLCLEITEGCRLLDMKRLLKIVTNLRSRGIRFAIDDFGTGFASIDILKKLPADVVKIDREFVKDIEDSDIDKRTVKHITELAAVYGPSVCAEGIETSKMRDILRQYPINTIQGYFYSKPIPFEEFMEKDFT